MNKIFRLVVVLASLELMLLAIYGLAEHYTGRAFHLNALLSGSKSYSASDLNLDFLERLPGPRTNFRVQFSGYWYVPHTELYSISARADDAINLSIDDRVIPDDPVVLPISAGFHRISAEYVQNEGAYGIKVMLKPVSLGLHQFDSPIFFPSQRSRIRVAAQIFARNLASALQLMLLAPFILLGLFLRRSMFSLAVKIGRVAIPGLILLYAAALRFEALSIKHGPVSHPQWLRVVEQKVVPFIGKLHPESLRWKQGSNPYEKGDPMSYLRMARNMKSFYAAQFREPFYVFVTKKSLSIFDHQNIAVSFGSAFFSVLAVAATYSVGSTAFSWPVGVLSMFLMTIEQELISLGVDGWRDDTFMFLVLMSAYGFLRLFKKSSFGNAIFTAFACSGACLTRLTSFSFIFPGFLFLAFFSREPSLRKRFTNIGLSLFLFGILIAPFLINCAIVYGDPLFSINDNTKFYRARESIDAEEPMPVSNYLFGKLQQRPMKLIDTGYAGMSSYPFQNKWKGFDYIWADAGRWLALFGLTGLFLFLLTPAGRLLLVILITSLVPYAFTWQIPGGSEWRFTMHAYPFYLIAASLTITVLLSIVSARAFWRSIFGRIPTARRILGSVTLIALIFCAGWFLLNELNYLRKLEAVRHGDSVIIEAGVRDGFFFQDRWFPPVKIKQYEVRIAKQNNAIVSVPLSKRGKYFLLLGIDRLLPNQKSLRAVKVFLNGEYLEEISLSENDPLVTAKRINLTKANVLDGRNEVEFEPVSAASDFSDVLAFSYLKAQVIDAYQTGVEKYRSGDFGEAIIDLQKAVQTEKQKSAAYYYLGASQLELQSFDEAITNLTKALQLSRGNPLILQSRGRAYYETKNYDLAIKDLQKVIKQHPENIEANYFLAMALRGNGKINESKLYLEKILELNPRDSYALKAREELNR